MSLRPDIKLDDAGKNFVCDVQIKQEHVVAGVSLCFHVQPQADHDQDDPVLLYNAFFVRVVFFLKQISVTNSFCKSSARTLTLPSQAKENDPMY